MKSLITGTSRGIGKFLAEYYLSAGHDVIGVSRGECDIEHANYRHFPIDVCDDVAVTSMFSVLGDKIDVLINNAGIASLNHTMMTPLSHVRGIFEVNVFAAYQFAQEAMRKGCKRIVNFSTIAVPMDLAGEAAYAASKAAIESLTRIWAKEFGPLNCTVNAIGPTPLDTDLIRGIPPIKIHNLIERQAIKRMSTMEDVANVVDFFIDEDSEFISGQTIYLGGIC